MMRYGTLFCLLLLIQGCTSDEQKLPPKPANVLSKDSMAFYLSQVHIIDAAMRHRDVRKKSLQPQARQGFINYFDTAGVSKERFVESLNYWKENYVEMEEIYDNSMEILSTRLAVLKQVESKDSLKAVNSKRR
jgi:hypothetical protein